MSGQSSYRENDISGVSHLSPYDMVFLCEIRLSGWIAKWLSFFEFYIWIDNHLIWVIYFLLSNPLKYISYGRG